MSAHRASLPHARRRTLVRLAAATTVAAGLVTGAVAPHVTAPSASAKESSGVNRTAAAVDFALAKLGTPYKWGGTGAGGYDCSGLTSSAYRYAGLAIPRTSRDQYARLPHVSRRHARTGDLLFWASDVSDPSTIYHVAIYLGGGMMVSAPRTGTVVQVKPVNLPNLLPVVARPAGLSSPAVIPVAPGSHGEDVKSVQRRLRANGELVPISGVYDGATYRAVQRIRTRAGVGQDMGTVGVVTWRYLVRNGARTTSA